MFSDLVLSSLNESAGMFDGPMDPRVEEITMEGANDIGGLDLMDYAMQSIYEFRSNIERADLAAVCEEYAYLKTNGVEMVEESAGDTIKEWFGKVKDGIVALGKRIAEFFKKVLNKLVEATKGDGLWLKTHQKKIDALPGNVSLKKPISGFKYGDSKVWKYDTVYNGILSATAGIQGDFDKIKKTVADGVSKTAASKDGEFNDLLKRDLGPEATFKQIMINIGISQPAKGNVKTIAQFKEALVQDVKNHAYVFSQVTGVQAMVSDLEKGMETRKKIKKSFESNKKVLNAALKSVNTIQKSVEQNTNDFKYAKALSGKINTQLSALVTANRVVMQIFEANRAQNKKLINAAIAQDRRDQKLEESAAWGDDIGDLV